MQQRLFREIIVNEQKRLDGRRFNEIRPVLPRTHGSAVVTSGEMAAAGASRDTRGPRPGREGGGRDRRRQYLGAAACLLTS